MSVSPLLPAKLSDRVRLDRYAAKDPHAMLKVGDLVVVSVQRYFAHKGKDGESREIGLIEQVHGQQFDVVVLRQLAPLSDQQESGVVISTKPHTDKQYEILTGVPRPSLEYIIEKTWEQICLRVADAVVQQELTACGEDSVARAEIMAFRDRIYEAMCNGKICAAGRILSGMGRYDLLDLTLFNCFVYAISGDSRQAITQHLGRIFDTFSRGGGVGWDLSILRPKGAIVKKVNGRSSGVLTWAELWSCLTGMVEQGGSRMGASSQSLSDWHPDVLDFIAAKSLREEIKIGGQTFSRNRNLIKNANISVLISNELMEAVKQDRDWDLVFPDLDDPEYDAVWTGDIKAWKQAGKKVVVYRTLKARMLWQSIVEHAWASAEPGVLFIGRANELSNSYYYARIICGNPCFEQLLPSNGICNLSHINVAAYVEQSDLPTGEVSVSTAMEHFDWGAFTQACTDGMRFLDNAIDLNHFHEEAIERRGKSERRVGLGILGLGEALVRLGLRYGSPDALEFTSLLISTLQKSSYLASTELARRRGPFPEFNAEKFLASGFIQQIASGNDPLIKAISDYGMRNVTCNTIAPTGSIAAILETTSGMEPYFDLEYTSTTRIGTTSEKAVVVDLLVRQFGSDRNKWPSYVVTAQKGITPEEHVRMQAAAQKYIDAAISRTVNLPHTATVEDVANTYQLMWELGCKGGTVYRDGSRDEQVLYAKTEPLAEAKEPVYVNDTTTVLSPRLDVGLGPLFSVDSPTGTLHIGIRHDPVTGEPGDLFVFSGKGDIGADVQAIGRLCSLILRLRGTYAGQAVKLDLIYDQLVNIPGTTQIGMAHNLKLSMPDAFAKVIKQYLAGEYPMANLPLGSQPLSTLVESIAQLPAESRQKLLSYLTQAEALPDSAKPDLSEPPASAKRDFCPACHTAALVVVPGKCSWCSKCGYSRC